MKLNVEIELDWIGEDSSIDDEIQSRIVNEVLRKISGKSKSDIEKTAITQINAKLDELVAELFNSFIDKTIDVYNEYGEKIKSNVSINEIIKQKFGKALSEKVDEYGRASNYGSTSRMDYLLNKGINKQVEELTKTITKDIDKRVKDTLTNTLKDQLGEAILKNIDLDSLLKNKGGNK